MKVYRAPAERGRNVSGERFQESCHHDLKDSKLAERALPAQQATQERVLKRGEVKMSGLQKAPSKIAKEMAKYRYAKIEQHRRKNIHLNWFGDIFSPPKNCKYCANLDSNAIYAALTNDSQVLVNQVLFLSKESSLVTIKQSVSMITSNLEFPFDQAEQ